MAVSITKNITEPKEIVGLNRITKKRLLELCKKDKLYQTPSLNDVLYLHYQGFQCIEGLEDYSELKCLWLECNAISEIEGLENQTKLKCLFLQSNLIKKIENLGCCKELDTINLSQNQIRKIENIGVDVLPILNTLNISSNYLKDVESLSNLEQCKNVSVLDLSNNRIDDILVVKVFAKMTELKVLVLQGNPVVSKIPQYRKTLILECKKLTYLDSRPVFPKDRACAEAWKRGGYEEERKENERWNRKDRKKMRDSVNATIRMRNRCRKPEEHIALLVSSDSEDETNANKRRRQQQANEAFADVESGIWEEVAGDDSKAENSSPSKMTLSTIDLSEIELTSDSIGTEASSTVSEETMVNKLAKDDSSGQTLNLLKTSLREEKMEDASMQYVLKDCTETGVTQSGNSKYIDQKVAKINLLVEDDKMKDKVDMYKASCENEVTQEDNLKESTVYQMTMNEFSPNDTERRVQLQIETSEDKYNPLDKLEEIMYAMVTPEDRNAQILRESGSKSDMEILTSLKTQTQLEYEAECLVVSNQVVNDFEKISSNMDAAMLQLLKDQGERQESIKSLFTEKEILENNYRAEDIMVAGEEKFEVRGMLSESNKEIKETIEIGEYVLNKHQKNQQLTDSRKRATDVNKENQELEYIRRNPELNAKGKCKEDKTEALKGGTDNTEVYCNENGNVYKFNAMSVDQWDQETKLELTKINSGVGNSKVNDENSEVTESSYPDKFDGANDNAKECEETLDVTKSKLLDFKEICHDLKNFSGDCKASDSLFSCEKLRCDDLNSTCLGKEKNQENDDDVIEGLRSEPINNCSQNLEDNKTIRQDLHTEFEYKPSDITLLTRASNFALNSFEKEARELRAILQKLETENEELYKITDAANKRESCKISKDIPNDNVVWSTSETKANEESKKLTKIKHDLTESFTNMNSSFSDLKKNMCVDESPLSKTIRGVIDSFNDILQNENSDNDQFIPQQRVFKACNENSSNLKQLVIPPNLKNVHKDTYQGFDMNLQDIQEKKIKETRSTVETLSAQMDKPDTIKLLDDTLMVIDEDKGELKELPETNYSTASETDYDTAQSEDEEVNCRKSNVRYTKEGELWRSHYKLHARKSAEHLVDLALEKKPTIRESLPNLEESDDEYYSLDSQTKPNVFEHIDREFFDKLSFDHIELSQQDKAHVMQCAHSYEEFKYLLTLSEKERNLTDEENKLLDSLAERKLSPVREQHELTLDKNYIKELNKNENEFLDEMMQKTNGKEKKLGKKIEYHKSNLKNDELLEKYITRTEENVNINNEPNMILRNVSHGDDVLLNVMSKTYEEARIKSEQYSLYAIEPQVNEYSNNDMTTTEEERMVGQQIETYGTESKDDTLENTIIRTEESKSMQELLEEITEKDLDAKRDAMVCYQPKNPIKLFEYSCELNETCENEHGKNSLEVNIDHNDSTSCGDATEIHGNGVYNFIFDDLKVEIEESFDETKFLLKPNIESSDNLVDGEEEDLKEIMANITASEESMDVVSLSKEKQTVIENYVDIESEFLDDNSDKNCKVLFKIPQCSKTFETIHSIELKDATNLHEHVHSGLTNHTEFLDLPPSIYSSQIKENKLQAMHNDDPSASIMLPNSLNHLKQPVSASLKQPTSLFEDISESAATTIHASDEGNNSQTIPNTSQEHSPNNTAINSALTDIEILECNLEILNCNEDVIDTITVNAELYEGMDNF